MSVLRLWLFLVIIPVIVSAECDIDEDSTVSEILKHASTLLYHSNADAAIVCCQVEYFGLLGELSLNKHHDCTKGLCQNRADDLTKNMPARNLDGYSSI